MTSGSASATVADSGVWYGSVASVATTEAQALQGVLWRPTSCFISCLAGPLPAPRGHKGAQAATCPKELSAKAGCWRGPSKDRRVKTGAPPPYEMRHFSALD